MTLELEPCKKYFIVGRRTRTTLTQLYWWSCSQKLCSWQMRALCSRHINHALTVITKPCANTSNILFKPHFLHLSLCLEDVWWYLFLIALSSFANVQTQMQLTLYTFCIHIKALLDIHSNSSRPLPRFLSDILSLSRV
jgi:hypothetical protein